MSCQTHKAEIAVFRRKIEPAVSECLRKIPREPGSMDEKKASPGEFSLVALYNRLPLGSMPWGGDMSNAFSLDEGCPDFEDLGVKNGVTHWSEEIVREQLGYASKESFRNVIKKAMQTCLTAECELEDNFKKLDDGSYAFTRFACYLLAMAGDSKKQEVAQAQVYFARLAETFQTAIEHINGIDRLLIRDEVSDGERSLASTARKHGVTNYPFLQNAGYRGMYNMNYSQLIAMKGVGKSEKLIDRMGKTELAAHLFRVTQTDDKIKTTGALGDRALQAIANSVGKQVRQSMLQISGKRPEDLPLDDHIKEVRKKIKGTSKSLKKLDGKKKKPKA